ncbi:MAG TPA: hypothetical protein P5159_01910 [Phycisphaerae bacterium]|nr:hypothetical protein [Phycisphaerae bacterium]
MSKRPPGALSEDDSPVIKPGFLCPFVDRRDARCANLLTMTNLKEAFRLCAGNHEACRVYHQIRLAELRRDTQLLVACSA